MILTAEEVAAVRFLVADFIQRRNARGDRIPSPVADLYRHLQRDGEDAEPGECWPDSDLVGAQEAARLVRLSLRQLQRRAPEFGGVRIDGRGSWVFSRAALERVCLMSHSRRFSGRVRKSGHNLE